MTEFYRESEYITLLHPVIRQGSAWPLMRQSEELMAAVGRVEGSMSGSVNRAARHVHLEEALLSREAGMTLSDTAAPRPARSGCVACDAGARSWEFIVPSEYVGNPTVALAVEPYSLTLRQLLRRLVEFSSGEREAVTPQVAMLTADALLILLRWPFVRIFSDADNLRLGLIDQHAAITAYPMYAFFGFQHVVPIGAGRVGFDTSPKLKEDREPELWTLLLLAQANRGQGCGLTRNIRRRFSSWVMRKRFPLDPLDWTLDQIETARLHWGE
ncbi:hypothetical protein ABIE65_004863 [Constrictibacter sp. MBR-5]|uniref:hypothetical protein n=1 Tax=Constrictibacter sp. MBR-5 TaxID=3156467 RepID=UPI003392757B